MTSLPLLLLSMCTVAAANMETPWVYGEGLAWGPGFWGGLKDWELCRKGMLQSPIDIPPDRLLFDPGLRPIHIDRVTVASELVNTGQMPRVRIGNSQKRPPANLSGGPLNNYRYRTCAHRTTKKGQGSKSKDQRSTSRFRIQRIDIHYGREETAGNGSEHAIDGKKFPMELQLLAFNHDLYENFSMAYRSPNGIAGIAVLVEIGPETNEELLKLTVATASIQSKGKRVELADLKPWALLPYTRDFVTYQGSMTSPGCEETVTWIVVNQPIHIRADDLVEWAKLRNDFGTEELPTFQGPNSRPLQSHNKRLLRTNIQHKTTNVGFAPRTTTLDNAKECKLPLARLTYKSNVGGSAVTSRSIPAPFKIPAQTKSKTHKKRHTAHKQIDHDADLFL
ncbi:cah-1 [Pristionchus pacificus]|uniref:Cah-1 n=1 Tax=Pristionchus pacificus TaxID=54126 RepID=A0A2A6CDA8_PRIPA|nr:cah-1 [Pristionchus pacificus]|eukprot:PDM76106.1 cah-1 [Pristionchus pacificus]